MQCYVIIKFFQVAKLESETIGKFFDINFTEPVSIFICVCAEFHDFILLLGKYQLCVADRRNVSETSGIRMRNES